MEDQNLIIRVAKSLAFTILLNMTGFSKIKDNGWLVKTYAFVIERPDLLTLVDILPVRSVARSVIYS